MVINPDKIQEIKPLRINLKRLLRGRYEDLSDGQRKKVNTTTSDTLGMGGSTGGGGWRSRV
jgi:hypothetical protein